MKRILRQTVIRLNRSNLVNALSALKTVHKKLTANLKKLSGKEAKSKLANTQRFMLLNLVKKLTFGTAQLKERKATPVQQQESALTKYGDTSSEIYTLDLTTTRA